MQINSLPSSINDQIQDSMADTFEAISAIDSPIFTSEHLLTTKKYFIEAKKVIDDTNFLFEGDNSDIIKAIMIDVNLQVDDLSERLLYSWIIMKDNLEKATSQEEFNATFALFVPIILSYMEAI